MEINKGDFLQLKNSLGSVAYGFVLNVNGDDIKYMNIDLTIHNFKLDDFLSSDRFKLIKINIDLFISLIIVEIHKRGYELNFKQAKKYLDYVLDSDLSNYDKRTLLDKVLNEKN